MATPLLFNEADGYVSVKDYPFSFGADEDYEIEYNATDDSLDFKEGDHRRAFLEDTSFNAVQFFSKLYRPDTGVFETATAGVEYRNPDQMGGFYGTVYVQYFNDTLPTSLTSDGNVATLIQYDVQYVFSDTNQRGGGSGYTTASGSASYRVNISLDVAASNIYLETNTYSLLSGRVVYAKN